MEVFYRTVWQYLVIVQEVFTYSVRPNSSVPVCTVQRNAQWIRKKTCVRKLSRVLFLLAGNCTNQASTTREVDAKLCCCSPCSTCISTSNRLIIYTVTWIHLENILLGE